MRTLPDVTLKDGTIGDNYHFNLIPSIFIPQCSEEDFSTCGGDDALKGHITEIFTRETLAYGIDN